jgi:hypothetical protein
MIHEQLIQLLNKLQPAVRIGKDDTGEAGRVIWYRLGERRVGERPRMRAKPV